MWKTYFLKFAGMSFYDHDILFDRNEDYYIAISSALDVLEGESNMTMREDGSRIISDNHGHAFLVEHTNEVE